MWGVCGPAWCRPQPRDLTLSAVGADPTVVSWGTWASGLTHPVTEWIVANDEGFTGSLPQRVDVRRPEAPDLCCCTDGHTCYRLGAQSDLGEHRG